MNINEAIAKNLNAVRKEQGMSIGKLARYTGLSKAAISQIEQGGANPTINTISKLASALHVPYTALLNSRESSARRYSGTTYRQPFLRTEALSPLTTTPPRRSATSR